MSDEEKGEQQIEEPSTENAPKEPKIVLNDQKKGALLRYMAVLFGVAFLLVALSFLIQIRDSSVTISQLNQSNASVLQNAEKLQTENRDLSEENKRITQTLFETQTDLDDARDQLEDAKDTIAEQEKAIAQGEIHAQTAKKNTEALMAATQARLLEDKAACTAALALVKDKDAPLEPTSKALFDQLAAWAAQSEE